MEIYILGSGVMATAMAYGLKDKFEITVVGRTLSNLNKFNQTNIKTEIYGKAYDIENKNIILAFKPHALGDMSQILKGRANLCISVLAMIKLENLNLINSKYKAVCIPNIAAEFKASTTPYYTEDDDDMVKEILNSFGISYKVNSDDELRIAGVMTGCVPAYLALIAEALCNAGVKEGLKNDFAKELISDVFKSTSSLLNHYHPAILKEMVCSPKGTTIEGILELEKFGIRGALMQAFSKSSNKF